MSWREVVALPALELGRRIASRQLSAVEAARAHLDAIAARDAVLHATLHLQPDTVLAEAAAVDRRAPSSPLHGVPILVKDNIAVTPYPCTAGSRVLEGFKPVEDATAVARLRAAGCVVLGKSNMDEFGMGSSTEHSAFGPTRNPHDLARVPGGSSGGSAAAVAAEMAPLALGSDTGGSIRQPAALCGVVGIKPSYGRVSRYGLVAYASSLDQVGPFARRVADGTTLLSLIAGADARDATSVGGTAVVDAASLDWPVSGTRVGVVAELGEFRLDPTVDASFRRGLAALAARGCELVVVSLPRLEAAIAVYYLIATAEASSNLARYDGIRYGRREEAATLADVYSRTRERGFGAEVKRRILLGTFALSAGYADAYYRRARAAQAQLACDFAAAFEICDVIATPTTPQAAFCLGEKIDDPVAMYLSDVFTVAANLAGLAGVSVPCGADGALPLGVQFLGPAAGEATLLRVAAQLEAELGPAARPRLVLE